MSQYLDIVQNVTCDNPHLRVRARNKPAIMIINDTTSAAALTSFELTINEGPFFFSTGDFATDGFTGFVKPLTMYTDPGVLITGSSLSPDGKTLTVNFSGLDAGERAIFNVDLDSSDAAVFPFPDYRNVLFGAPWAPGDPTTDPASYVATFTGPTSAPNMNTVSGDFQQLTEVPDWSNDNIRPYEEMDMVEHIPGGGVVPEPSSALIALAAVAGMAALRRGRLDVL
jgi:hypothetical protein